MKAYSSFSEQGRWNEWGAGSVIPKTTENVCLVMYQIETPDLQQSSRYNLVMFSGLFLFLTLKHLI
ncbi:hypothetical protein HanRHA438_Chr05g0229321 [Helianthus annuus]|nr:hypothetical protein HanRHA438_Chr05g0229321 [Helianthus annuus]